MAATRYCFPKYVLRELRLQSFEYSLFSMQQRRSLVDAGFFYTGRKDETICYCCGGGLKNWEDDDDPWVDHATWFPRCKYLLLSKGKEFVDTCLKTPLTNKIVGEDGKDLALDKRLETVFKEKLECVVCLVQPRDVVFFPCKHCCVCTDCGAGMIKCVICRSKVVSSTKIYLS